jgi:hypothetical protein
LKCSRPIGPPPDLDDEVRLIEVGLVSSKRPFAGYERALFRCWWDLVLQELIAWQKACVRGSSGRPDRELREDGCAIFRGTI